MQTVVTFCIATYQNYDVVRQLIDEILSVESDEFDVVVCDDHSEDGSVEKLKQIDDKRLHVFENDKNLGSMLNFYYAVEHGAGRFLFYLNDRDCVDSFKIKALITILKNAEDSDISFFKCKDGLYDCPVFAVGHDAYIQFGCRIEHPTGYIYRRDIWKKTKNRKRYFEDQRFGDYPFTYVCADMAQHYSGMIIGGDICDFYRQRIDFSKVRSRFFNLRKDKRLWFTAQKQWKELETAYLFSKKRVSESWTEELFLKRYEEYLRRVVLEYRSNITNPVHTLHYGVKIPNHNSEIFGGALKGGAYMFRRAMNLCIKENKCNLILPVINITSDVTKTFLITSI